MEKFKAFFNKTFWQGVAVTVLCYIVFEKFGIFSKAIIGFFINVSTTFSDWYYRVLASNVYPNNDSVTVLLLLAIVYFLILFYNDKTNRKQNKIRAQIDNIKAKIDDIENGVNNIDNTSSYQIELSSEEKLSSLNMKLSLSKELSKTQTILVLMYLGIAVLISLYILVQVPLNLTVNDDKSKFKQSIIILLPYIGQDEVNKLNSSWALMTNTADYNKITTQIEEAKKKYLPIQEK